MDSNNIQQSPESQQTFAETSGGQTEQTELDKSKRSSTSYQPSNEKNGFKKILAMAFVVITFGVVAFFSFSYLSSRNQVMENNLSYLVSPTPFTFGAEVVYLEGNLWKVIEDRKVEVIEGDLLGENDTILTDENSKAVISLDDGSVIRIGENTRINLESLQTFDINVLQESGMLFARVNKDENHLFNVTAGNVIVSAQGTAFSVEKEAEVKVKVFESQVLVEKGGDRAEVQEQEEWNEIDLSVNKLDDKELTNNEFLAWSLEAENLSKLVDDPTPTPTKAVVKTSTGPISLSGEATAEGIRLNWEVGNINVSKGFKIVKNLEGNPAFPGSDAKFVDGATRTILLGIRDGKTWHIRICQFLGDSCGVYSNEITVKAPLVEKNEAKTTVSKESSTAVSKVNSIALDATKVSENKAKLEWSVDGESAKGFKAVWSTNSGPTFPTREGDWFVYLDNPASRSTEIGALEAGKTYYFRVCEYLGGKCGKYSNEKSLSF